MRVRAYRNFNSVRLNRYGRLSRKHRFPAFNPCGRIIRQLFVRAMVLPNLGRRAMRFKGAIRIKQMVATSVAKGCTRRVEHNRPYPLAFRHVCLSRVLQRLNVRNDVDRQGFQAPIRNYGRILHVFLRVLRATSNAILRMRFRATARSMSRSNELHGNGRLN